MKYKFIIQGDINAEDIDDAIDILSLTLEDVACIDRLNVSSNEISCSCKPINKEVK